jgi:uncharacterized RDD family membrane protein YckC
MSIHKKNDHRHDEQHLATFSERVLAFTVDWGVFAIGFLLSPRVLIAQEATLRQEGVWYLLWASLFLVYQAYAASDGRVSLGKNLLGLRVVDLDNHPLTFGRAVIRSVGYLASSVFSLGFIWPLFAASRQAWHDLAAGSVVIRVGHRPSRSIALVQAGACACLALFAGLWAWQRVVSPRYYRIMVVGHAQVALKEMAQLQTAYHDEKGRYADNVFALASVSVAPRAFLANATRSLDAGSGVKFQVSPKGYTIIARARDSRSTLVSISGS